MKKTLQQIILNQIEIINLLQKVTTSPVKTESKDQDEWVKAERICEFLSISPNTLKKYRENKAITTSRYLGNTLYNLSEVIRQIKKNAVKTNL